SLGVGLTIILVVIIYAYGFEVTKVNLDELRSERRQESLARVTRALFRPDIIEYDRESQIANGVVFVSCPANPTIKEDIDTTQPYITVTPACAEPGETVLVEGFNFTPSSSGPVRCVPGNDSTNVVELGNERAEANAERYFAVEIVLPNRPSDEEQYIRATMARNVGAPRLSQVAKDTWGKIIETVFLALLATTLGTILAIPLSFIAARNLMKPVRSPLTSIALSTLGWPIGIAVGFYVVKFVERLVSPYTSNFLISLLSVILIPVIVSLGFRWALPQDDISAPKAQTQALRFLVLASVVLLAFFGLYQLSGLTTTIGISIESALSSFAFLGKFVQHLSDILVILIPIIGALTLGAFLSSTLGRL